MQEQSEQQKRQQLINDAKEKLKEDIWLEEVDPKNLAAETQAIAQRIAADNPQYAGQEVALMYELNDAIINDAANIVEYVSDEPDFREEEGIDSNDSFQLVVDLVGGINALKGSVSAFNTEVINVIRENYPDFQLTMTPEGQNFYMLELCNFIISSPNLDLASFQKSLGDMKAAYFNPNVIADYENYNASLLKACMLNPTDANFEIFKYLVEVEGVSIEGTLNASYLQSPPPDPAKTKQFFDYIDAHTNDLQRNQSQFCNLALFFNQLELFEKLVNNPAIEINSIDSRSIAQASGLADMEAFSKFIDKVKDLPDFDMSARSALAVMNQDKEKMIKLYNSANIDSLALLELSGDGLESDNNLPYNRLLFLNNPGVIDIVHKAANEGEEKAPLLPKLTYIMQSVKELEGLDLAHIAKPEHAELLSNLNHLTPKELDSLALSLDFKNKDEINDFATKLSHLAGSVDNRAADKGIQNLKQVMLEHTMGPIERFFNNPTKVIGNMFSPSPAPIDPINPASDAAKVIASKSAQQGVEGVNPQVLEVAKQAVQSAEIQNQGPTNEEQDWQKTVNAGKNQGGGRGR